MFRKFFAAACLAAITLVACGSQGGDKIVMVKDDAYLGPVDAKVTVVEYGSPTCPGCKYWHDTHWPEAKRDYVDTNKIKFVFREFAIHGAVDAAIFAVARCTGPTGFFRFLDEAFASQRDMVMSAQKGDTLTPLSALGARFGLNAAQVKSCMDNPENIQRINDVGAYVRKIGVNSTPTFFVNGVEIKSADLDQVWIDTKAAIEAGLAGGASATPAGVTPTPAQPVKPDATHP